MEPLCTVSQVSTDLWPFDHFTQTEIHEQPMTLRRAVFGFDSANVLESTNTDRPGDMFDNCQRICLAASGTSWHADRYGKYLIEELVGVPVDLEYASDYRYRRKPHVQNTIMLALSQSGETADTLAALRNFQETGQPSLAICNVPGSTLADATPFLNAGQESGVAATKTYTSQLMVLASLAMAGGSAERH